MYFLTFDDGPSNSTEKILNILKDKDVHGTFFVLGSSIEKDSKRQEYLKEELKVEMLLQTIVIVMILKIISRK